MDPQTINAMYSFNENEISESHHKFNCVQTFKDQLVHVVISYCMQFNLNVARVAWWLK